MALEDQARTDEAPGFLSGGGEMGALIRAHDWSGSPLGPPENWPQPLRTAVRLLLNTGHPMYIWWGPELLCFYNDAYRQSIGAERHPGSLGLPGRQVWDEIWDIIGPQIEQVMAGRGATWHENQLVPITRNGRLEDVYWTYSYSPIDNDDAPHGVGGVLVVCTETTQKVLAEQRLAAQVERQRALFARAPGFIAILSGPDHVFEFANDSYSRLVGGRDLIGRTVRDAFPELAGQGFHELLDRVFATGERFVAEQVRVELQTPSGALNEHFLDFIYEPVRDDAGAVTGIFCEGYDVTERKRAEEKLRESEARFREQFENANDYIFTADLEMRIVSCNPAVAAALGHSAESLIGHSIAEFVPSDVLEKNKAMLAAKLRGEQATTRYEVEVNGPGGDRLTWEINSRLTRDAGGHPTGLHAIGRDVTARHRAEEALREQAEELQTVLDAVPAAIWIARDPNSREIVGNRRSYEVLKLDPGINQSLSADEQVRPAGFSIFHDGRELAVDELPVQRAATGVAVERFEEEVRFADGSDPVHLYGNAAPLRDAQGNIRGAVAAFVDITEAKRAEAALRESEARFRDLAENIPILCWMAHADGNIFWYNRGWHEYTGTTPEEQHGWGWEKVHDPEMLPAVGERWRQSLASGTPFEMTFPLRGSDGVFRPFLTRVVPIRGANGEILRWFGTNTDVTDLRAAEEALRIARTRAEAEAAERSAILNQLVEGVIVTDADGRITFVNEAAKRLHGVAELDIAPADYSDTYHLFREDGSPYPSEELPLARAVLHGEAVTGARWRIRRPDGTDVLAIGSAQPLRAPDGTRLGAVLTVSDDTARRGAEQALRSLNETLEQRVEERTEELVLAQEQLRQSQKLEAMGQLTGGVAHDFNNLLTPIIGGLDMLKRRGIGGEREQRLIDGGLQSAERAKTLVQRLLAFARRQPLQPGAVDVAGLVAGMADLIASTSGPQVRLIVDLADALPAAKADRNQLEMAILNLSVNARDAMPNGGTLTISAAPETVEAGHRSRLRPGDYLRLSVADTGVGMDEATLARSIEPFFSTKGIGKGTGLGLSMVHGLAAQLGGGFAMSSRPGLGTCVDLWLPLSDEAAGEAEEAGPKFVEKRGKGIALLVDDEELVRISTADMLSECGYEVVEVASAAEALKELEAGLDFDLLVTDHMMPGMSGADLAREVRERLPGKPVLIVSGYAETEGIAPDLPRLTKPFRQADLAACLSSMAAGE